ncbi:hypothetical protein BC937DRAFT_89875 [Endogone sp. FLAS-F59071]|nr:hypothetical protein BC937DRAFT_89875 [Endogone sp. FLAS-F59071]|eukprot:RUS17517.1 hypothetical protein BC937DRAFT_89875 [Endogone sp. FLAS-F59071]
MAYLLDEDHTHIARQKPYVKQKVEELDDWSIYVAYLVGSEGRIFGESGALQGRCRGQNGEAMDARTSNALNWCRRVCEECEYGCYVRFNTSEVAAAAIKHFATERIVHWAHTDHRGAELCEAGKSLQAVQLRILTDQEETVYWDRVESGPGQQTTKNKGKKAPVHEPPQEPKSANIENTITVDQNVVMGTKPKGTHIRFAGEEDDEDKGGSTKRAAGDELDEKVPNKYIRFDDSD